MPLSIPMININLQNSPSYPQTKYVSSFILWELVYQLTVNRFQVMTVLTQNSNYQEDVNNKQTCDSIVSKLTIVRLRLCKIVSKGCSVGQNIFKTNV